MFFFSIFFNLTNLIGFCCCVKQDFFIAFFSFYCLVWSLFKIITILKLKQEELKTNFFEISLYLCLFYFSFLFIFILPSFIDVFKLGFYFIFYHEIIVVLYYHFKEPSAYFKTFGENLYYNPLFLNIISFWKKQLIENKANFSYKIKMSTFLKVFLLLCYSWYTALNTRFFFARFFIFLRGFIFPLFFPLTLFYFFGLVFLCFLKFESHFKNLLIKDYSTAVFVSVGWNNPLFFLKESLLSLFKAKVVFLLLCYGDEYFSVLMNLYDFELSLRYYTIDYNFWFECRSDAIRFNDLENFNLAKPKEPNFEDFRNKRFSDFYKTFVNAVEHFFEKK